MPKIQANPPKGEDLAKLRVYLIDDHPLLVQGITQLINAESDMCVVGATGEWTVALKQIKDLNPGIIVLDITLANANGVEVLKNLKVHYPELKVLMLSMHDEDLYAMRSVRAGAFGYVMKAAATEQVVTAIRQIIKGEIYLSEGLARRTMSKLVGRKEANSSLLDDLSDRELEVYQLVGDGMTTRQIANRLHLSVKTIESHKAHLKEKLHLQTATELAQHAIQQRGT